MTLYTRAILRRPCKNFVNALSRDPHHQKPDYDKAVSEFMAYAKTIESMGLQVTICDADENFPDGNFVEDTYLILDDKVKVELNPGAPSRNAEPMSIAPFLPHALPLRRISKSHSMDGGDVLQDDEQLYVGMSSRTQLSAINELRELIAPFGYSVKAVTVPEGLHLKSGMTKILHNHFLILPVYESLLQKLQEENPDIKYFVVPEKEDYAANVLAFNGKVLLPAGCAKTKAYLQKHFADKDIYEVDTSQVRLVDGALTCGCLLIA